MIFSSVRVNTDILQSATGTLCELQRYCRKKRTGDHGGCSTAKSDITAVSVYLRDQHLAA